MNKPQIVYRGTTDATMKDGRKLWMWTIERWNDDFTLSYYCINGSSGMKTFKTCPAALAELGMVPTQP